MDRFVLSSCATERLRKQYEQFHCTIVLQWQNENFFYLVLYMVAIASYHSGAHLMKPQFPIKLRTTLSQGRHISYKLVTTLPLYTRLLLGYYNLVRLSTGCDNLGISIWEHCCVNVKFRVCDRISHSTCTCLGYTYFVKITIGKNFPFSFSLIHTCTYTHIHTVHVLCCVKSLS